MKISLTDSQKRELLTRAADARLLARVPRTGFHVGAAVLTSSGDIITGCNVEIGNMLYSICAERTAIVKAVSAGYQDSDIVAVAVVSDSREPIAPCGFCRQFLLDFGADILVIMSTVDQAEIVEMTVGELSPMQFNERCLK